MKRQSCSPCSPSPREGAPNSALEEDDIREGFSEEVGQGENLNKQCVQNTSLSGALKEQQITEHG